MMAGRSADFIFLALALLLPLSALIARGIPNRKLLLMGLMWLTIVAVGVLIVRGLQEAGLAISSAQSLRYFT